jgi:hypothetical protein
VLPTNEPGFTGEPKDWFDGKQKFPISLTRSKYLDAEFEK